VAYRELPLPTGMRELAECAWLIDADATAGDAPSGCVLPDGCMDVVWTGAQLVVAGPDTAAYAVYRVPGVPSAGVRFRPGRLPGLLGVPAAAVRDQRVPLADLSPGLARDAIARLDSGEPVTTVLVRVADGLAAGCRVGDAPEPWVGAAARALAGGASADATADALGWTPRTLHRRSLAAFGYGPAVLRRVLRFRRAVDLLHAGVPIAEAAATAGYADQPHLSREVRALAGTSPRGLVADRWPDARTHDGAGPGGGRYDSAVA
jgi:AraC-like DNA-binding protein